MRSQNLRSEAIEGRCSRASVRAGESLDLFLRANLATDVPVVVYRIGYYGGKDGRHVARLSSTVGHLQRYSPGEESPSAALPFRLR